MKKKDDITKETKQRGLFKKRRGGVVLSKEEVKEIKAGRKKLRKELRRAGIKSRKEFELTASSMGLYFDKNRWWALLLWFWHGKALWGLLGATALLLTAAFGASLVSQMRGHFTINLGDDMFRLGFTLSETEDFAEPQVQLFSDPLENVPCISIISIPEDVGEQNEGNHSGDAYFAYTFFLRNESDVAVDYEYTMDVTSESLNLSCATWIMLFQDGEMVLFAEGKEDGSPEVLPALDDNTRGYRRAPLYDVAKDKTQYSEVDRRGDIIYYRLHPKAFESSDVITSGRREDMQPNEIHKYTVVMWLEGDDPECTDDLIGGHLGIEMNFNLLNTDDEAEGADGLWNSVKDFWDNAYKNLKFWE